MRSVLTMIIASVVILGVSSWTIVAQERDQESPLEVRFGRESEVSNVFCLNERIYLCVVRDSLGHPGTIAYVANDRLFNSSNIVEMWDVVGASKNGPDLVVAMLTNKLPGDRDGLVFFNLATSGVAKNLFGTELERGESFCRFMHTTPTVFLTTRRVGDCSNPQSHKTLTIPLSRSGSRVFADSDISGKEVLCGWSHVTSGISGRRQGELQKIDLDTGKVEQLCHPQSGSCPGIAYDGDKERITFIAADPIRAKSFFVGIGAVGGRGRLLRIGGEKESTIVFSQKGTGMSMIRGLEDNPPGETLEETEESILGGTSVGGRVYFATARGVYSITEHEGEPAFLGEPVFRNIGGIYMATNLPELVLERVMNFDGNIV